MQAPSRTALREGALILFMILMLLGLLLGGCASPKTLGQLADVQQRIETLRKAIGKVAGKDEVIGLQAQLRELKAERKKLEEKAATERLSSAGTITQALEGPAGMIPVAGPIASLLLGAVGQFLTARANKKENGNA